MLTSRQIDKLRSIPGRHRDDHGLYLQVGKVRGPQRPPASWILRYQRNGKVYDLGLGPLYKVGLEQARKRAAAARLQLLDGINPVEHRRQQRLAAATKPLTFGDAVEQFFRDRSHSWSSLRHRQQFTNAMAQYAIPIIGKLPVSTIDVPLVLKVLEQPVDNQPFWKARPPSAMRLRNRIQHVLDWCKARGHRSGDNPADCDVIGKVLTAPNGVKHHPALPYADVPQFMSTLRNCPGTIARAMEFLILVAARSSEVLGAKWSEIDLDAKVWTVPAERMKARTEHRVPLSTAAVQVLTDLPRETDNEFVFLGDVKGRGLSPSVLTKLLRRLGRSDVTAHGMRSAFRDFCAELTNYPREVAEQALAHHIGAVERAYRRSDLFNHRRRLMEEWTAFCYSPKAEGTVTPLRGRS
jgi:integrase